MGSMLEIFVLLSVLITVPRWAAALAGVDEPISAWVIGLLIEIAAWACARAMSMRREANSACRDAWLLLSEEAQQKKPDHIPQLGRPGALIFFYVLLLLLSLGVQVPFYVARFRGVPVQEIVSPGLDCLYIGALDISPEIATTALIVASRTIFIAAKALAGRRKGRVETLLNAMFKQWESRFHVEEETKLAARPTPITISEDEFVALIRSGELVLDGRQEKEAYAKKIGKSARTVHRWLVKANNGGKYE